MLPQFETQINEQTGKLEIGIEILAGRSETSRRRAEDIAEKYLDEFFKDTTTRYFICSGNRSFHIVIEGHERASTQHTLLIDAAFGISFKLFSQLRIHHNLNKAYWDEHTVDE